MVEWETYDGQKQQKRIPRSENINQQKRYDYTAINNNSNQYDFHDACLPSITLLHDTDYDDTYLSNGTVFSMLLHAYILYIVW